MSAAAVAAVAALAGVLLGHVLNRNAEYRKWLRSERHIICAKFLETAQTAAIEWRVQAVVRKKVMDLVDTTSPAEVIRKLAVDLLGQADGAEQSDLLARAPFLDAVVVQVQDLKRREAVKTAEDLLEPDFSRMMARRKQIGQEVAAAQNSVALICSADVVTASRSLLRATLDLQPGDDQENLDVSWARYEEARSQFVRQARRSLIARWWRRNSESV